MKFDFSNINVLVIGDLMVDNFLFGNSTRKSPEADIPIITPTHEYSTPGGSGNVAFNLASLGAKVSCIGVIGNDNWGQILVKLLNEKSIDTSMIIKSIEYPTTLKKRVYLDDINICRIDYEKILKNSINDLINENVNKVIKNYDIVILSDYNKGVLNEQTIQNAVEHANGLVVVDPKKEDFSIYKGANILTPNIAELDKALNLEKNDNRSIISACRNLINKNNFEYIVNTRGSKGITIVGKYLTEEVKTTPVFNADVTGAGDTVVSVLSLVYFKTNDIIQSARIANKAGKSIVSKKGTAVIKLEEI